MNLYREDMYTGGWFSFNSTKEDWKSFYAQKMYQTFFNTYYYTLAFGAPLVNEELLITKNLQPNSLLNKKVLVIGGGPSSKELTEQVFDSYDVTISCNHFYKNSFFKNKKVTIALLGDEVDLNDKELLDYINLNDPIIGFEHSSTRSHVLLKEFVEGHDKTFLYLTRYFSRLGYVARGCVLARLLGSEEIDFIGMDGFSNNYHFFEQKKSPPPFDNKEMFTGQAEIFFRYMLQDLKTEKFYNLGEESPHSIYNGLLEEVKNEGY